MYHYDQDPQPLTLEHKTQNDMIDTYGQDPNIQKAYDIKTQLYGEGQKKPEAPPSISLSLKSKENFPLSDPRYNPKNCPYAGGEKFQDQTSNIPSYDNPMVSQMSNNQYNLMSAYGKQTLKEKERILHPKEKGNSKGLGMSNNTSEGNPLNTLDRYVFLVNFF